MLSVGCPYLKVMCHAEPVTTHPQGYNGKSGLRVKVKMAAGSIWQCIFQEGIVCGAFFMCSGGIEGISSGLAYPGPKLCPIWFTLGCG
jgi:hypothetical protein